MIMHVLAHTERHGKCRSCGRPIVWAVLADGTGQDHPFDPPLKIIAEQPSLFDGSAVHSVDARQSPSHFATCPRAHVHRNRPGNR